MFRTLIRNTYYQVSSVSQFHTCGCSYYPGWKKRVSKRLAKFDTVNQYAAPNTRRAERIYGWGLTLFGALGVKTLLRPEKNLPVREKELIPVRLSYFDQNDLHVYDITCGLGFSAFLTHSDKGDRLYGTGINTDSQLGCYEYPRNSGRLLDYIIEPVPVDLPVKDAKTTKLTHVACGRAHTIVCTANEGLFSLGNNSHGQCCRPAIDGEVYRGNKLVYKIQFDQPIKQVVCGADHTLLLTDKGQVYSCGLGTDGQTGQGHFDSIGLLSQVKGDIEGEKIVHVASRMDCVLAVSEKGDIFGWGNSEYDQLAVAKPQVTQVSHPTWLNFKDVGKVTKAASAGSMCLLLNDKGQVFTWGYGILGKGPNVSQSKLPLLIPETLFGRNELNADTVVTDIVAGVRHFAAVTNHGDVYVWGKNDTGCLGLGHINDQMFPYKTQVPAEVLKVGCGLDHMIAFCKSVA